MEEVGNGNRDVAGDLQEVALAEVDVDELVGGRSRRSLQARGAAPCVRVRRRAGDEVDCRSVGGPVLALVDRDRDAAGDIDAVNADQARTAACGQREVALGTRRSGDNRLGEDDRQIVDGERNADCVQRERRDVIDFAVIVAVGIADADEGTQVVGADGQHGHPGGTRGAHRLDEQFLAL